MRWATKLLQRFNALRLEKRIRRRTSFQRGHLYLGARRSLLSGGKWSPASLFKSGEQGLWLDPSDFATMFQDAAGTTPVTAVEQPVGLILDKRLGLVFGPELVAADATFSTSTGWVLGAGWSIGSGVASTSAVSGGGISQTTATITTGKTYLVSFDKTGASVIVFIKGSSPVTVTANGRVSCVVVAGASGSAVDIWSVGACSIDNISVREIPGNHATQPTSTSRPVLSARVNTLLNSQWSGGGLAPASWNADSANGILAPNGTIDGNFVYRFTEAGQRYIFSQAGPNIGTSGSITASIRISSIYSGGINCINVLLWVGLPINTSVSYYINGLLVDGSSALVQPNSVVSAVVTSGGTGGTTNLRVGSGCAGVVTVDIDISRPQIETGSVTTRYQRVNTATDYDTAGFPLYLKFDGIDDFLVTNSINFTGTDKMTVWAGVRLLTDALDRQSIVELGTNSLAVSGSFGVQASPAFTPKLRGQVFGSSPAVVDSVSNHAAPKTLVMAMLFDIAGATARDEIKIRANGVMDAGIQVLNPAGTGNYGNYPIYIGRCGGISLPFNGNFYQLIARGAQTSTADITNGEKFTATKTGVVL